eukprot:gene5003-6094_t
MQLRSGADGLLLWTNNITAMLEDGVLEGGELYALQLSSTKGRIDAVGLTAEHDATLILNVDLESGQVKDTASVASKVPLAASMLAVATKEKGRAWVGLSADGRSLLHLPLGPLPLTGELTATKLSQPSTELRALGGDLFATDGANVFEVNAGGVSPGTADLAHNAVLTSALTLADSKGMVFASVEASSSSTVIKLLQLFLRTFDTVATLRLLFKASNESAVIGSGAHLVWKYSKSKHGHRVEHL